MTGHKLTGACTRCDAMCFRVLDTQADGSPKRLGPPLDGAVRVSFMLMDGTRTSLTFCAECADMLPGELYVSIWQKVIRSWIRELAEKPVEDRNPDWLEQQFSNGILCEMGRSPWKELVSG